MESKELTASYTKGEWYLQKYTDAYTNIIRCNKGKGFETIFIGYTGQSSSPETRANARLMAAAPYLLEALQEIIAITDRDHTAWDKAKIAINKALAKEGKEVEDEVCTCTAAFLAAHGECSTCPGKHTRKKTQ